MATNKERTAQKAVLFFVILVILCVFPVILSVFPVILSEAKIFLRQMLHSVQHDTLGLRANCTKGLPLAAKFCLATRDAC